MDKKIDSKLILSMISTGLLSFSGVLVETATNGAFPTLIRYFSVSTSTVQWMTTGNLLVASIMMTLSAYFKHSFTTKKIFLVAAFLFVAGLIIDSVSTNFTILIIGRMIQGMGVGISLPLMFNIILEQAPPKQIGFLIGTGVLITSIAPAIGPTFGGFAVSTLGWRFIFITLIPVIIIAMVLGLFSIRQVSTPTHSHLNLFAFFLVAVAFIGLIFGFSNLSDVMNNPIAFIVPFIIGLIALIGFLRYSFRTQNPLIDVSVLKVPAYRKSLIAFFLSVNVILGMSFVLSNYIQIVNRSSALVAGLVVLPGAILGAGFSPLSGWILDRFSARRPIILGVGLDILAMIAFLIFARTASNSLIVVIYAAFMLGVGLATGNIMTNAISQLPRVQSPDGNALFNTLQQFSGAAGTAFASTLINFFQNSGSRNTYAMKTALGAQSTFVLFLVFLVIGFLLLNSATKLSKKS